jgi:hypothetical protein
LHETLIKVDSKEANCTHGGNAEYYECECGSWFADEKGKELITQKADVYTVALGHDYSKKCEDDEHLKDEGSCQSKVTYWYACSRCGVNAKDDVAASDRFFEADVYGEHDFSSDVYEKDGEYFRKCAVNGCEQTETADKEDYTGDMSSETEKSSVTENESQQNSLSNVVGNILGCSSSVNAVSASIIICVVLGAAFSTKRRK